MDTIIRALLRDAKPSKEPIILDPLGHEVEKRTWRRRLVQAIKDGLELEGSPAVHVAITEAMAGLEIGAAQGRRPARSLPQNVRLAMKLWCENPDAKLKQLAHEANLSIPQIREWMAKKCFREAAGWRMAAAMRVQDRKGS